MKRFVLALAVLIFTVLSMQAQTVNSYISDMGEALVPYGTISAPNCHRVEINLIGPWGDFAIPDGINKEKPDELMWVIVKVDVLRLLVNLSDLDEDKVLNHAIFSTKDAAHHQAGTRYVPDTPAVMIFTNGLNTQMTAFTVDLKKLDTLTGRTVSESQMGVTMAERRGATILFSDQAHADAFQKAIQKAIVVCKAQ